MDIFPFANTPGRHGPQQRKKIGRLTRDFLTLLFLLFIREISIRHEQAAVLCVHLVIWSTSCWTRSMEYYYSSPYFLNLRRIVTRFKYHHHHLLLLLERSSWEKRNKRIFCCWCPLFSSPSSCYIPTVVLPLKKRGRKMKIYMRRGTSFFGFVVVVGGVLLFTSHVKVQQKKETEPPGMMSLQRSKLS